MKKAVMSMVLFLLLTSLLAVAQEEIEKPSCSGFWGSIKCFFFGNPENRAEQGWFEREAVVGKVAQVNAPQQNDAYINEGAEANEPYATIFDGTHWKRYDSELNELSLPQGENQANFDRRMSEQWTLIQTGQRQPPEGVRIQRGVVISITQTQVVIAPEGGSDDLDSITEPLSYTFDSSQNTLTYQNVEYSRSGIAIPIGDGNYYVFTAPDGEHFVFYGGGWRQVAFDSSLNENRYRFQESDGTFTEDYRDADQSSLLTPEIGTGLITKTIGTPPAEEETPAPAPPLGPRDAQTATEIDQAINCLYDRDSSACARYKPLTYGEAYDLLDEQARTLERAAEQAAADATTPESTKEDLIAAPAGSTVTIGGVQYTKIDNTKGWRDKDNKRPEESSGVVEPYQHGENFVNSKNKEEAKKAQQAAKKAREAADKYQWQGTWFDGIDKLGWYQDLRRYGSAVGDIATAFSQLGSYRALSNALMPDATASWMEVANSEVLQRWADLPNFAAREACGFDDQKRVNTHGSSSVFVRTPSGTVQFVGSIQAERSERKSAVLCELNPDPEAEEEWICNRNEVCVDEQLCYKDANNDGDPDNPDQPEEGFFYKITWGVTAPVDERHTPYIDEDGKAVKFNIILRGDGEVWLYEREGASVISAIALANGESDRDAILHYSPRQFTEACIKFDSAHRFTDAGGDTVGDVCVPFALSQRGAVEFSASARSPSATTASGQVNRNRNW